MLGPGKALQRGLWGCSWVQRGEARRKRRGQESPGSSLGSDRTSFALLRGQSTQLVTTLDGRGVLGREQGEGENGSDWISLLPSPRPFLLVLQSLAPVSLSACGPVLHVLGFRVLPLSRAPQDTPTHVGAQQARERTEAGMNLQSPKSGVFIILLLISTLMRPSLCEVAGAWTEVLDQTQEFSLWNSLLNQP